MPLVRKIALDGVIPAPDPLLEPTITHPDQDFKFVWSTSPYQFPPPLAPPGSYGIHSTGQVLAQWQFNGYSTDDLPVSVVAGGWMTTGDAE